MDPQRPSIAHALHRSPVWMAFAVVLREWWVRWARWAKRVASTDNFTRRARDQALMTSVMQSFMDFIRYVVQVLKNYRIIVARRPQLTPSHYGCESDGMLGQTVYHSGWIRMHNGVCRQKLRVLHRTLLPQYSRGRMRG